MTTAIYIQDKNSELQNNRAQLHDSLNIGDMFIDNRGSYYLVCNSNYGDESEDVDPMDFTGRYLFSFENFMIYDYEEILSSRTHHIYFPVQIVNADITVDIQYSSIHY